MNESKNTTKVQKKVKAVILSPTRNIPYTTEVYAASEEEVKKKLQWRHKKCVSRVEEVE